MKQRWIHASGNIRVCLQSLSLTSNKWNQIDESYKKKVDVLLYRVCCYG